MSFRNGRFVAVAALLLASGAAGSALAMGSGGGGGGGSMSGNTMSAPSRSTTPCRSTRAASPT